MLCRPHRSKGQPRHGAHRMLGHPDAVSCTFGHRLPQRHPVRKTSQRSAAALLDHTATIVGVDRIEVEIVPLADKVDLGRVGGAAPGTRRERGAYQLAARRKTIMHHERAARADQLEALLEIAPRGAIFVERIDQRDIERQIFPPDRVDTFGDIEVGRVVVDRHSVAWAARAAIHQSLARREQRPVDLGV